MTLPETFGTWPQFEADWCLGTRLGYSSDQIAQALSELERHWPERIHEAVKRGARGIAVVGPLVEDGLLVLRTQSLAGFNQVFSRIKRGERSAYTELIFAATLVELGYSPTLEPSNARGGKLDTSCTVETVEVCFEIVVPEQSNELQNNSAWMSDLTSDVMNALPAGVVEIDFIIPEKRADFARAKHDIQVAAKAAANDQWTVVGACGRFRHSPDSEYKWPDGPSGPARFVESVFMSGGATKRVRSRWVYADGRAKRFFKREYHHFDKDKTNVLVVNACESDPSLKVWPVEIAQVFRKNQNRNVGAVAMFEQGFLASEARISRRWRIVTNPFAHNAVPEVLLAGIESLDESVRHGLPKLPRVSAC